ncbi:MAG TPA: LysR family transcriptional regulator [Thermoanaerobaculia bacterium]|jgi:molybdate transport system regulatory protein|nr:LysR family transcriptional regulator [Thermoanaerobaculia bacterium]
MTSPKSSVRPRIRVLRGSDIALGPGKVDLLDAIEEAGTLAGAAQRLGMSYMRAWKLVQTMNACFREPLVETTRGGKAHGHAALTDSGKAVRDLYRKMEAEFQDAVDGSWQELRAYLAEQEEETRAGA